MARLTPLAKGLVTLSILAVAGAAAWHLGLKNMLAKHNDPDLNPDKPKDPKNPDQPPPKVAVSGALDSKGNPLKVSIVSFHGYAPALVANGKSLTTQGGSIYDKLGINVDFVIQDDIPTLTTIFTASTGHCAWRTSDFWAQEQPNLQN